MKLHVDRLSKQFGSKIAVDRVSTTFESGIYGLLGANGSGKTTLMRMICGVLRPTSGEILLGGTQTEALGATYRDILGYLPQDFGYYPDFTALNFMRYIAALKGIDKKQMKQRSLAILEEVGLGDRVNSKIKTFSGGMKQRLGIAQAVINDPKILILDEPTAGLDPQERVRFRNLISKLSQDRVVILSTHIVSDVEYIAKNILVMKQGGFILEGSPAELEKQVAGKVWEMAMRPDRVDEATARLTVSNIYFADSETAIARVISEQRPSEDARSVNPTLEDLYLYHFRDEEPKGDAYRASRAEGGSHA
jgi:ABC-2 type transport system ATP-binding protein